MDVLMVYFKDDGQRKDFPLKQGKVVVGRQDTCDYRIPHNQISREHCEFEMAGDDVILRDLESRNGTFVNNKRIAEIRLRAGDHVVIGPVVFTVQIDGEPADLKPVRKRLEDRPGATTDDAIASALGVGEEEEDDDETRRTGPVELDPDQVEATTAAIETTDEPADEAQGEEDSVGKALEALASDGGDDNKDDPFSDLEEDEL